jgi:hypothetical protein
MWKLIGVNYATLPPEVVLKAEAKLRTLAGDAEAPSQAPAPRTGTGSGAPEKRESRREMRGALAWAADRSGQAAAPGVPWRHSSRSQRTRT